MTPDPSLIKEEISVLPTRILLASDGSEEATRAARSAVGLSNKVGAELHVVYVGHMPYAFYEAPGALALDRDLATRMEERLLSLFLALGEIRWANRVDHEFGKTRTDALTPLATRASEVQPGRSMEGAKPVEATEALHR